MNTQFYLNFEDGMPKGTAQQHGERIGYKRIGGKLVPYIDHYRKANVQLARNMFTVKMKPYRPKQPSERPIKLLVCLYFDVKQPKKLWGKYKTTRPDCDNYVKEIKDVKDLEKEFRKMDVLQQFMIQVWVSLASSYSNKFVDYNFDMRPEVLTAHQQLYSTLYFFGFRLTDEYKAVIEGTSELYLIDGKEVTK